MVKRKSVSLRFCHTTYFAMLQNWLLPQMSGDSEDFIFQQDGAPHIGTGMFDVF